MNFLEQGIVVFFGISGLFSFLYQLFRIKKRKSIFTLSGYLFFMGAFVWGDLLILGPFWVIVSFLSILFNNWYLFLILVSIFWTIRSLGEVIYWLNEQFGGKTRNPPHTLKLYKYIRNDAVWFIYQLFWQCIFVFSFLLTLYFSKMLFFNYG